MPLGAFKAGLMGASGVSTADIVLLHDTDYSNAASAAITSGIDSTYKEYIFRFYDIDIVTNQANWTFQVNAAGASGFNETITSTWFYAAIDEISDGQFFAYQASHDQAQGTGYQTLTKSNQNDADASSVGELHLFDPASTTYMKHFYFRRGAMGASSVKYTEDHFGAGYINTTTAIDEISFKASAGNFSGTIKMWGVK